MTNLPFDCVCEIVHFLREVKSYLNLLLSNKMFWDCFQIRGNLWATTQIVFGINAVKVVDMRELIRSWGNNFHISRLHIISVFKDDLQAILCRFPRLLVLVLNNCCITELPNGLNELILMNNFFLGEPPSTDFIQNVEKLAIYSHNNHAGDRKSPLRLQLPHCKSLKLWKTDQQYSSLETIALPRKMDEIILEESGCSLNGCPDEVDRLTINEEDMRISVLPRRIRYLSFGPLVTNKDGNVFRLIPEGVDLDLQNCLSWTNMPKKLHSLRIRCNGNYNVSSPSKSLIEAWAILAGIQMEILHIDNLDICRFARHLHKLNPLKIFKTNDRSNFYVIPFPNICEIWMEGKKFMWDKDTIVYIYRCECNCYGINKKFISPRTNRGLWISKDAWIEKDLKAKTEIYEKDKMRAEIELLKKRIIVLSP